MNSVLLSEHTGEALGNPGDGQILRVYDKASLLTPEQEEYLERQVAKLSEEQSMDIVLLTLEDLGGLLPEEAARAFYAEHQFGFEGPGTTGVVYLIDMENHYAHVVPFGYAMERLAPDEMESMLQHVYPQLASGDYYETCLHFLNDLVIYAGNEMANPFGYFDLEKKEFVETGMIADPQDEASAGRLVFPVPLSSAISLLVLSCLIGALAVGKILRLCRAASRPASTLRPQEAEIRITARTDREI